MSAPFRNSLLFLFIMAFTCARSQYTFTAAHINDKFEINSSDSLLYCIYRPHYEDDKSIFRKVFLNEKIRPFDSVDYIISGNAKLLASAESRYYHFHVFLTKINSQHVLDFLISDKKGAIISKFTKTPKDFTECFGEELNFKHADIEVKFVSDQSNDIMLFQIRSKFFFRLPNIVFAVNIFDGRTLWFSHTPSVKSAVATDSTVILLSHQSFEKGVLAPTQIHGINKQTGEKMRWSNLFENIVGRVDLMTANRNKIILAAMYRNRYYMISDGPGGGNFNVQGSFELDKDYGNLFVGYAFDANGNLILFSCIYRLYPILYDPEVVRFIAVTTLSGENGSLISFKQFPVEPMYGTPNFKAANGKGLFTVSDKAVIYDIYKPGNPPKLLTSMQATNPIQITSFGPIVQVGKTFSKTTTIELFR